VRGEGRKSRLEGGLQFEAAAASSKAKAGHSVLCPYTEKAGDGERAGAAKKLPVPQDVDRA